MPTVTWERGLMRWWMVCTVLLAVPLLAWTFLAAVAGPEGERAAAVGLCLAALTGQQLLSYAAVRVLVWIIKGFIGAKPSPPATP